MGRACLQPTATSLILHIKPVITADIAFVSGLCGMMSLHACQAGDQHEEREVLLTFSFSSRRIWFYLVLLTGTVVLLHRRNFSGGKKNRKNLRMQKQTRTDCVNGKVLCSATLSVSERARDTKHAWEICCFPYKSRISFFSKPLMAWALLKKSP